MITRSRRAALNSSSKPSSSSSSSNLSFDSPSTSKHNNKNNHHHHHNINNAVFGIPNLTNGNELNLDDCNNNLRRSSRRLTTTSEKFTGLVKQQQQQPLLPNGNTIEDIVKDVIGNIVDYVSQPGLKDLISTKDITDYPVSLTKSTDLSSNFLHCNENAIFSNSQPSPSLSSTTTSYPGNVGCNEYDYDESDVNRVEAITCEVSFDADISEDDCGLCPVCGLYGRLDFEGYIGDRLGKICSKRCVDKLQINGKACICVSCGKRIASDSQGYLANFGVERSTLCSEECLQKFEKENEPSQKCYSCKKEISFSEDGNLSIFYWQTMEFCSPECIENLQQFWGEKCTNCDSPVPQQSLGKYSVRFGNVIKQFCHGSCLEQYKKAVKVCAYCQVNLSGCMATCTSVTGGSSTKRIREFCDPVCRSHYLQMVSHRNNSTSNSGEGSFSSLGVQCCQCSRIVEKSSCLDVIFRGRKFLICSTFCLSAFKFSFDVTKIICESCSKYGWSSRSANILHYSGFTKIFCSRKCLQMHVLKIRRIQSCLTCNVKKYNFDLVEKYDSISGDSKLFCSTFCYAAFEHYESQSSTSPDPKSFCDWCRKLARLPFHIPSPEKTVRNFCTYSCVLAHQRHESINGQFGFVDNHPRLNQLSTKSNLNTNLPTTTTTTTTPSDPIFKQPGTSSSFNYRQSSPVNPDNYLSTSNSVSDPVRSTSTPPSVSSPPSSSLSSLPSRSSPFVTSFTTPINAFQRSYQTRSKTSSQSDGNDNLSSTIRPLTHHDHNLNTTSTVPSPFFNSNNQCKKSDDHLNTNDLSSSASPMGLPPSPLPSSSSLGINHKNLGLSSPYILDASTVVGNFADKSTMWQPSRRSKATLCRPIKKDRHTQTDVTSQTIRMHDEETTKTDISDSNEKLTKYIPVPIFVPFFVPIPFPVPLGSTSLIPLPLPTPIPFGFPIDSRLSSNEPHESSEQTTGDDKKRQQFPPSSLPLTKTPPPPPSSTSTSSSPSPSTSSSSTTTTEKPKTSNPKELNRKKPKSANRSQDNCNNLVAIVSAKSSSEYQHSTTTPSSSTTTTTTTTAKTNTPTTTTTSESKNVKPIRLKRNASDYSDSNNFNSQSNLSANSKKNNDNYPDDNDTCSNTSSSDDREKTKRRRVTIPTHG